MSRLRIVCKAQQPSKPGALAFFVPSFADLSVTLISEDGSEHPITNISGITWTVKQGPEAASATLTFEDVEIDAEAHVELDPETAVLEAIAEAGSP